MESTNTSSIQDETRHEHNRGLQGCHQIPNIRYTLYDVLPSQFNIELTLRSFLLLIQYSKLNDSFPRLNDITLHLSMFKNSGLFRHRESSLGTLSNHQQMM